MTADSAEIAFVNVLGPVHAVTPSGCAVYLASVSQRRLVALLAAEAPRSVRAERIQDMLGLSPSALRTTVSRVRRVLGATAISGQPGHYCLALPVDAARFADALSDAGLGSDRASSLRAALALWRGPPFDEFAAEDWARPEVTRLTELRASAVEELASELIALHRGAEAITELQRLVAQHPLRDRPRALLLRALAAEGRQADALRAFEDYRVHLAESVGTEPSPRVRRIDRLIASGWDGIEIADAAESERPPRAQHPRYLLPLPAELSQQTTVIGRDRAMAQLTSDLALVGGTGSRTVVVEGEAGIGKTALLAGFAQSVHGDAATVLHGRCPPDPAPLEPFRALFQYVLDHLPAEVLEAHTTRCGPRLGRMLRRRSHEPDAPGLTDDDATERRLLFEAAGDVLRRISAANPVVVLLDDLQWAEPTALGLLRHLVRLLVDAPILWVLSVRDTEEQRSPRLRTALADVERRPSRRIVLHGLEEVDLAELAASLVPLDDHPIGVPLMTRLRDATAGNPLYAIHLVRHWLESGHLRSRTSPEPSDDQWPESVPASLRNLLWSRVAMLGDDVVDVLSAAAVLGTEFAEDAVIDMVDMSESAAMNALDVAERAHLLINVGPSAEKMRFVHALVAGAVYSELPGRRRRRLHAAAARALEGRAEGRTPQLTVQLARHSAAGGMLAEALTWARTAGDDAADALSPAEAVRWYRTALEHGAALGVEASVRAELLVRLGRGQHQINDSDAPATLTEAVELGRRCGATATVVHAALATDRGFLRLGPVAPTQVAIIESALAVVDEADIASRARLLALLAEALPRETPGNRRIELARDALALADTASEPVLVARICSSVLYALWGSDREATRLRSDLAHRGVAIAEATSDVHLEFSVHAAAYTVAIQLADPVTAAHSLERMHAISEQVGTPEMRWTVDYYEAFVATMEARFVDAGALLRNAVGMSSALGVADVVALFAGQMAALAVIAGHRSELPSSVVRAIEGSPAQHPIRRAHDIVGAANGPRKNASDILDVAMAAGFTSVRSDAMWTTSMVGYAMLAIDLADTDAAVVLLEILEPHAGEVATNLGPVALHAGRLAMLLGQTDRAERSLVTALEVVDAFGWDLHRATTRLVLAGCRRQRLARLDAAARRLLDEAERIATDRGLPNVRAEVDRIRAEAPLKRT